MSLQEQSLTTTGMPAPADLDELRDPSSLKFEFIAGKDSFNRSSGCTEQPSGELLMESEPGGICWAIWQIPDQPEYLHSVYFDILDATGDGCFLGIADFDSNRWLFSGPHDDQTTRELPTDLAVSAGGYYYVAVVTHDGASVLMAQLFTYFEDGWQIVTVSEGHVAGINASIADISGHPAIAYRRDEDEALRYAWSSTGTGDDPSDWTDIAIPTMGTAGFYCSLAEVNGRPAISFRGETDAEELQLHYALSSNSSGSSPANWNVHMLDPGPAVASHTSLAVVNGRPAIAYGTVSGEDLFYTRSFSLHGDDSGDWSSPVAIDHQGTGSIGWHCSLAVVNGRPAVSYYADGTLRYCWSSTADGQDDADWNIRIIDNDSASNVGLYSSLAVISGKPAISYYDQLNANLKFAWSDTEDGKAASDWSVMEVIGPPIAGQYCSLVELDGNPAVCYYTVGLLRDLLFASAVPAAQPEDWLWNPFSTVDGNDQLQPADVGQYCSMAVVNGRPAIAYHDATNGSLRYAVRVLP